MRILVEPSDYVLGNFGDMAMLQTAVSRLAEIWPKARIDVLTHDPEGLARLCPAAAPLSGRGRELWLRSADRGLASRVRNLRRRDGWASRHVVDTFRSHVASADLVLVAGMGGVTDAFPEYATGVLETLRLALATNRTVALVGQGIGPLERPDLRSLAAEVLPRARLIGLREQRSGLPLLRRLKVADERIVVTGDDAIEMAHAQATRLGAPSSSPSGIGVNFRVASYSGADDERLSAIADGLRAAARSTGGDIIPVPISRVPGEDDLSSIRRLIAVPDAELSRASAWSSPADVVAQLSRCRVLVTGSYHAAVFALSIGVPAIGLAASRYYEDKFYGLADMFGAGCAVINLRSSEAAREGVAQYVEAFWRSGPMLKSRLLSAAAAQLDAGRSAYGRLKALVARAPQRPRESPEDQSPAAPAFSAVGGPDLAPTGRWTTLSTRWSPPS